MPSTSRPSSPTVPEIPVVPEIPIVPIVPVVPEIPVVPVVPEIPVVPIVPEIPVVPIVPEIPVVPVVPTVPEIPTVPTVPDIFTITNKETIHETGLTIVNESGTDNSNNPVFHTSFTSTNPELYDPDITQNFVEVVTTYDDVLDSTSPSAILLNDIKLYAGKINCTDFQGKGTIDDYANLFEAACKIANETKQVQLDVDIDGFNEFAVAADELSKLFESFTIKLQSVNIIDDTVFLSGILEALKKISHLSDIFGKFKETILTTATIQMPKSAHEASLVVKDVMDEVNCAMGYISYFVNSDQPTPINAELSIIEKNIITKAVTTIDNWNIICNQGVSIAMSSNTDIKYIKNVNTILKQKTTTMTSMTQTLKTKLTSYLSC